MCAGARYRDVDGRLWSIYFPNPKAALPVNRPGGAEWAPWGRRNKSEPGTGLPVTGWARGETIAKGSWEKYEPEFVTLAVQEFMEKERTPTIDPEHPNRKPARKSHWFQIQPGQAIEALIAHWKGEQRLYVVTADIPPEYDWLDHDRWPRIIDLLPSKQTNT